MRRPLRALALAAPPTLLLGWALWHGSVAVTADEPPSSGTANADEKATRGAGPKVGETTGPGGGSSAWTTAVTPKPLGARVKKGLAWLAEHQDPGGGWSQGEESPNMAGGQRFRDTPDVADTCIAALALIRSGSTPRRGPYRDAVAKAVRFVRGQVEASDSQSLSVSSVQGTRVQMKLGPNIDTFLASLLLAEVKGEMPDEPGNAGVVAALDKVLDKIKKNQKADGSWDNQRGWAPVIAQAMCGKGVNRAAQNGVMVPPELLARTEAFAKAQYQLAAAAPAVSADVVSADSDVAPTEPAAASGPYGGTRLRSSLAGTRRPVGGYAGPGSAGVELYDRAASVGVLQDSVNTNAYFERDLKEKADKSKDAGEREQARKELSRIGDAKKVHREAQDALLARLDDPQFIAGFGSNGGEEFLSYMNISESLVVRGGRDWTRWDDAMTANLERVQNDDGSWSGHHCITGRTFCTSTALLVLLADRTPVPVAPGSDRK